MAAIQIKTAAKVVPQCYAYTTPGVPAHDGWTKIGFTERDVVRHKLVQKIILAYDKYERENARRDAERRESRREPPKKYHRPVQTGEKKTSKL